MYRSILQPVRNLLQRWRDYGLKRRLQSVFDDAVRNTVVHIPAACIIRVAARNWFSQQANDGHVLVE